MLYDYIKTKKYFTIDQLNQALKNFKYDWKSRSMMTVPNKSLDAVQSRSTMVQAHNDAIKARNLARAGGGEQDCKQHRDARRILGSPFPTMGRRSFEMVETAKVGRFSCASIRLCKKNIFASQLRLFLVSNYFHVPAI